MNDRKKLGKCFLGVTVACCMLWASVLPIYAAETTAQQDGKSIQVYALRNISIHAESPIYKQIAIQEEPLALKGSLKNRYIASLYTIQNNSDANQTVIIEGASSASEALKDLQNDRTLGNHSLFIIPAKLSNLAVYTLASPVIQSMYGGVSVPNRTLNQIIHTEQFLICLIPITTTAALLCLLTSATSAVALAPLNLVVVPIISAIDKHRDNLSKKQIEQVGFKESFTTIELTPNEKAKFAVLTPTHMKYLTRPTRPILRIL